MSLRGLASGLQGIESEHFSDGRMFFLLRQTRILGTRLLSNNAISELVSWVRCKASIVPSRSKWLVRGAGSDDGGEEVE